MIDLDDLVQELVGDPTGVEAVEPEAKVGVFDLLPRSGDELYWQAYRSLIGDPAAPSVGTHQGKNVHRRDTQGITKSEVAIRVLTKDFAWFDQVHAELVKNPFNPPKSLRTWIEKSAGNPDKGVRHRPIDDGSEIKRLVCLHLRERIEPSAEKLLHPGQYGGRPLWAIQPKCPRPGATSLDHVATAIHQAIWDGYGFCLLLDLRDAFGLVPKQAVMPMLGRVKVDGLRLSRAAQKLIWRYSRIDAVDSRSRSRTYRRGHRGIEQGDQLSALVMNMALAPILFELEEALDVRVVSYLDDIYVLARTRDQAEAAYRTFKHLAVSRGFTNIRPLVTGTVEPGSKASRIVDTASEPVLVLKTYLVDRLGISLEAEKIAELTETGDLTIPTGISKLRSVSRCMALTKRATRERTRTIYKITSPKVSRTVNVGLASGDIRNSTGACGNRIHLPPSEMDLGAGGSGLPSPTGGRGPEPQGESGRTLEVRHAREPIEDSQMHVVEEGREGGGEHPVHLYPSGGGLRATSLDGSPVGGGDLGLPVGAGSLPVLDPSGPGGVPSQGSTQPGCNEAGGTSGDGGSSLTAGGDTPSSGLLVVEGHDQQPRLPLSEPQVVEAIREQKGFRFGDKFKGHVLDLSGLGDVLGTVPDDNYIRAVNGLIRAVRGTRVAQVVIDPMEPWTCNPQILGNRQDTTYVRRTTIKVEKGRRLITLVQRKSRTRPKITIPEADVVLLSVKVIDEVQATCRMKVRDHGTIRQVTFESCSPVRSVAWLEAVVKVVTAGNGTTLAVPRRNALHVLDYLAAGQHLGPAQVHYAEMIRTLSRRTWRREGDWFVAS